MIGFRFGVMAYEFRPRLERVLQRCGPQLPSTITDAFGHAKNELIRPVYNTQKQLRDSAVEAECHGDDEKENEVEVAGLAAPEMSGPQPLPDGSDEATPKSSDQPDPEAAQAVESDAEELPQIDLPDETKATEASGGGAEPTAQIHNPLSCQGQAQPRVLLPKKLQRNFRTRQPPSCPMSPAAAATATGSELPASAEVASAAAATAGEPAKVAPKEPEHKPEDPEEDKGNETRKGTEDLILTSPQKRKADTPAEEIETGAAPKAKAKAAAKEPATKAKAKPKAGTETKPKAKASALVEQSKAAASGKKKN